VVPLDHFFDRFDQRAQPDGNSRAPTSATCGRVRHSRCSSASRFRAIISGGLAVVYAGTTYSVVEAFTPETGAAEISDSATRHESQQISDRSITLMPTLQLDATERTGFYLGAVLSSALNGSYEQAIASANANYATKIGS